MNNFRKIIRLEQGRAVNALRRRDCQLQQLFWECTLRCNLHCRHCGSDCLKEDTRTEMPLERFTKVLDQVAEMKEAQEIMVITTGGEPLIRDDIVKVGREITQRGFYWGMVTNGMLLTKSKMQELMEAGLNSISVSLDGLDEDHNWMRGSHLSFTRAVEAVKVILDYSDFLAFDVITCVNRRNLATLPQLQKLLCELGVDNWRLITIFPSGRAANDPDLLLDGSQIRRLMDFIKSERQKYKMNVCFGCEGFLGPYENEVRDYQFFCQAGINCASVLHDGSISGCLSIRSKYHEGNVLQDDFTEIWKNGFKRYRDHKWMKIGPCRLCEVWRWCQGNGMHLRDDDGRLTQCLYQKMFHNQ